MKKYLQLEISKAEALIFFAIICWIAASLFVDLPKVNSLGH
ncbi:MAG: hypothetical protein WAU23_12930 [Ferruginibacter sp.]